MREIRRSPKASETEAIDRFCRTCVSFHESRAKFFPEEAPDVVPPVCYSQGRAQRPGWCQGALYQEGIP
jgi:hypothetical protein